MAQNKNMKQVSVPLEEKVQEAVQDNSAQVKKPSILGSIAQAGLQVAKEALPMAVSAIPGVGPVLGTLAKGLLSTMNDDEWFGEYKSAGATFNELLGSSSVGGAPSNYKETYTYLHNLVGTMAFHYCFLNFGPAVKENVFPAMLAFVRKKTDNVLVDDTDKYWYSIADTAQLYAIYYSLRKYLKLAGQLPLNAPTLNEVAIACAPATISQLTGIADTLRDFLKTSTGIPYALAEYLRWRFGTVFLSENSEKAGFITYDPAYVMTHDDQSNPQAIHWMGGTETVSYSSIQRADLFISSITAAITHLKNDILAQGRANADIALAFKDHQVRYDVEERHYDEKEFNLRCNLDSQNGSIVSTAKGTVRLILDSKLNMSAAIQAVSMSTIPNEQDPGEIFDIVRNVFTLTDAALIHISDIFICSEASRMINGELYTALSDTMYSGTSWFFLNKYGCNVNLHGTKKDPIITSCLSYDQNNQDLITFENLGLGTNVPTYLHQYLRSIAYKIMSVSLQMHYNEAVYAIGTGIAAGTKVGTMNYFQIAPLSYDTAIITNTQLLAIQRQCIRNLFRGEYTRKSSVVPKVAEAVSDLVEVSSGDTNVLTNDKA